MVVGCPFVEMIGNVVSSWIGCCVFKINDNDLGKMRLGEIEIE